MVFHPLLGVVSDPNEILCNCACLAEVPSGSLEHIGHVVRMSVSGTRG